MKAVNVKFWSRRPGGLVFSFARTIQQPALEIRHGKKAHALAARQALIHQATGNRAARRGGYHAAMERT